MKKLLTICLMILIFSNYLMAQEVNVNIGPEFTAPKRSTLSAILGCDKTGYYVLQNEKSKIAIVHFNNQQSLTLSKVLEPQYEGKDLDFEDIFYINEKIYLFTSFKNQKIDKKFLFYQTIDKTTLTPNNDLKKISEIDFSSKYNSGSFWIKVSQDTSKILFIKNLPYDKADFEKFELKVFDKTMTLLWEKAVTLPYEEKLFDVSRYIVSNDGNAYILGKLYDEKAKDSRHGHVNYKYKILSYKKNKSENEYTVSLGTDFITDLQIAISPKEEFICSGFYSSLGTHSIEGTYFMKIDPATNKIISQHQKAFPKDFLTQYETEKEAKKIEKREAKGKDVELYEYDLDDLIIREDGGAYLIGEQYYVRVVTRTTSNGNGGTSTNTTYYYNYHDIIVISFTPDGSIGWFEKIPKRQVTANDGGFYSSYVKVLFKDKLYLIFNDHIDNLNTWTTGKLKNYSAGEKGIVTLVSLGLDGKQSRSMLFKTKDIESIAVPKVSEQISKSEVIIYSQKKKTHQFSKVVFK